MSTTEEPQQQLAPKPAFKKHSGKVQKEAAKILKSTFTQISSFAKVDPFNKLNCVIGLVNRQDGVYGGSLVLTHVNNVELPQKQLVYGMVVVLVVCSMLTQRNRYSKVSLSIQEL